MRRGAVPDPRSIATPLHPENASGSSSDPTESSVRLLRFQFAVPIKAILLLERLTDELRIELIVGNRGVTRVEHLHALLAYDGNPVDRGDGEVRVLAQDDRVAAACLEQRSPDTVGIGRFAAAEVVPKQRRHDV